MAKRTRWLLLAGMLLIVLVFAAYAAWLASGVKAALSDARSDSQRLRVALEANDEPGARKALDDFAGHAAAARDKSSDPAWRVLEVVPFVGDDAAAVALASAVADDLATRGIEPLLDAGALDAERFTPRGGRIDTAAIAGLARPMASSARALADARERLGAVDAGDLLDALAADWGELTDEIADAADAVEAARVATELLPPMLGADGPRHHLIVFNTPSEPRATGGMPGSIARLDVREGELELGAQRAASAFPELDSPVLPLTPEEETIFGKELGTFVMDAAFVPHFPRVAELVQARWEREHQDEIAGVIAIDPVALGYLLEATGPVKVDGTTLTADNLAALMLHDVYKRIPDPKQQDVWFQAVAATVFEKVRTGPVDSGSLVKALARGVSERRIFLHSADPEEQAELAGTAIAGELSDAVGGPAQAGVFLNDATGSKMGWFLDYDVEVTGGDCDDDGHALRGTMTLRSTLKPGTVLPDYVTGRGTYGVARGDHLVAVEIFAPQGGRLGSITFDGKAQDEALFATYRKHRTTSVAVFLEPGAEHTITWRMSTPSGGPVRVDVGAGVRAESESSVVPGC